MITFQHRLPLTDFWNSIGETTDISKAIAVRHAAPLIAGRLEKIPAIENNVLAEALRVGLSAAFYALDTKQDATMADLDFLMEYLYDWGSMPLDPTNPDHYVCLIETHSNSAELAAS